MHALLRLFRGQSAPGMFLIVSATVAMIAANSPASRWYEALLGTPVEIRIGDFVLAKPLLLWINDGLMAVFFFAVGLELKREILQGKLSRRDQAILPIVGAAGGILGPAAIYSVINAGDPVAMKGWAIPAATDIAFSLGVLALLGKKVPLALKVFLVSLATIDDVGAIAIIACFYTGALGTTALTLALPVLLALFALNRARVSSKAPYLLLGIGLWALVLKSGVHATLAGVLLAFFVPMHGRDPAAPSPLHELERDLIGCVSFGILPLFAFANAGINLAGLVPADALQGVPLGIALGLFVGKPVGILATCWLVVKLRLARLPEGVTWPMLGGVSCLCGIGFTMSLFIGSLAFEQGGADLIDDRIGILLGSAASGLVGFALVRLATASPRSSGAREASVAIEAPPPPIPSRT